MQLSGVMQLFEGTDETKLQKPKGEVDVLIGFGSAGCFSFWEKSADHLLVIHSRFGVCLGGSHILLQEGTKK